MTKRFVNHFLLILIHKFVCYSQMNTKNPCESFFIEFD